MKPPMRITVRTQDEDAWRSIAGPEDIEAWCAAHGWNAADISSGSVVIDITPDDAATVTALRVLRDPNGKPMFDPNIEDTLATEVITSELRRPLPKGVGLVEEA